VSHGKLTTQQNVYGYARTGGQNQNVSSEATH
jgi:hypothetical protein